MNYAVMRNIHDGICAECRKISILESNFGVSSLASFRKTHSLQIPFDSNELSARCSLYAWFCYWILVFCFFFSLVILFLLLFFGYFIYFFFFRFNFVLALVLLTRRWLHLEYHIFFAAIGWLVWLVWLCNLEFWWSSDIFSLLITRRHASTTEIFQISCMNIARAAANWACEWWVIVAICIIL